MLYRFLACPKVSKHCSVFVLLFAMCCKQCLSFIVLFVMSHIKVTFVSHISKTDLLAHPIPQLHTINDIILYNQNSLLTLIHFISMHQKYSSIHIIRPTNACKQYVFITYYSSPTCFNQHHDHHQSNLQQYQECKQSVKMYK